MAAPGAASSIPFMARVAVAGEGFLATEAAVAPMPLKLAALPIVNGLPMAQPENYGPVGGGFASGGMPGQSNVMLKSPSEILGENLEAAGQTRPVGSAAHHIVPYGDWRAADLRTTLGNLGIDINSADNGVFLPQVPGSTAPGAYHPSLNSDAYHEQLRLDFLGVNSKNDALDVLDRIRSHMLNGTYPGSKPTPPKP